MDKVSRKKSHKNKIILVFVSGTITCIIIFLSYNICVYSKQTNQDIIGQNVVSEVSQEKERMVVRIGNTSNQEIILNNKIEIKEVLEKVEKKPEIQKKNEYVAKIKIPSAGINESILAETSTELMEIGLNKYWGANPNEIGNCCIIGHNYKNGKQFGKLKKVKCGDLVYLTDNNNITLKYQVYDIYTISPENTDCTSQITNGKREITLITCTNAGKNRLIVKAKEI